MIPCLLLGLSLTCALIACGKGAGEEKGTPRTRRDLTESASNSKLNLKAAAFVCDLSGRFEDCGCSGNALGGLARIVELVASRRIETLTFVGKTLVSQLEVDKFGELSDGKIHPELTALLNRRWAQFTRSMGYVSQQRRVKIYVYMDDQESELLRSVLVSGHSESSINDLNLAFDVGAKNSELDIKLSKTLGVAAKLTFKSVTSLRDRSRTALVLNLSDTTDEHRTSVARYGADVLIVGLWGGDGLNAQANHLTYRADLGIKWEIQRNNAHKASTNDKDSSLPSLSAWRVPAGATQSIDKVVVKLLAESATSVRIGYVDSAQLHTRWLAATASLKEKCASCHTTQVERFLKSAHSRSLEHLIDKKQAGNPDCLSCHADLVSLSHVEIGSPLSLGSGNNGERDYGIRGTSLSCYSCHHERPEKLESICSSCHTPATDPDETFRKRIGSICAAGLPEEGTCIR